MCRLAYIPGSSKVNYAAMSQLFSNLVKSCGGDGNGYVAVSPEGQILSNKGVKLTVAQIVKQTYKLVRNDWSLYFHTRKVSVGWIDDEQCHPFEINGKAFKGWMCHNGTWSDGSVMAKYFNCGSDTAAFARLIGQFGLKKLKEMKLFPSSGVFLLYGGKPRETPLHRVLHIFGDLEYCPKTGVWASEFGDSWEHWGDTYSVEYGRHMLDKQPPKKIFKNTSTWDSKKGWTTSSKGCEFQSNTKPKYGMYASDVSSKDHEDLFNHLRYSDEDKDIPPVEYVTNHYTNVDRNLLS